MPRHDPGRNCLRGAHDFLRQLSQRPLQSPPHNGGGQGAFISSGLPMNPVAPLYLLSPLAGFLDPAAVCRRSLAGQNNIQEWRPTSRLKWSKCLSHAEIGRPTWFLQLRKRPQRPQLLLYLPSSAQTGKRERHGYCPLLGLLNLISTAPKKSAEGATRQSRQRSIRWLKRRSLLAFFGFHKETTACTARRAQRSWSDDMEYAAERPHIPRCYQTLCSANLPD